MKKFVKIIVCIVMIVAMTSVVTFPAFATRLPTVIKPLETMAPAGSSGTTTGRLPGKRPIISLTPTTEPPESSETPSPSLPSKRPIISLTPTTEPESNSSSAAPSRPLRGEENLIPTTEPSSVNTGSGVIQRPIKGEENLLPTTPSPTPSGTIQKPTTTGTTSSGTSTVQPTESATKPTEAAPKPTASISKSPYFIKHPTDEDVKSGANAQFVEIAENADGYNWIILSADGKETYSIAEACSRFKGLKAEGSIATRLTLYCTNHPVDLILMDMAAIMEDDGLERVQRLKMRFPNVKIIMITDLPEYSYITCAKQIGAESFWYMEPVAESLFAIIDKTMEGESIYPDSVPVSKLGCALSTDFTERELEVLREVVGGKTDAAIAEALTLSVSTVKFHIQKIREKTGFTTRTELAVRTRESGLVISQ